MKDYECGDREVRICKITNKPTEMIYEGKDFEEKELLDGGSGNGHPGWLYWHDEFDEDGQLVVAQNES